MWACPRGAANTCRESVAVPEFCVAGFTLSLVSTACTVNVETPAVFGLPTIISGGCLEAEPRRQRTAHDRPPVGGVPTGGSQPGRVGRLDRSGRQPRGVDGHAVDDLLERRRQLGIALVVGLDASRRRARIGPLAHRGHILGHGGTVIGADRIGVVRLEERGRIGRRCSGRRVDLVEQGVELVGAGDALGGDRLPRGSGQPVGQERVVVVHPVDRDPGTGRFELGQLLGKIGRDLVDRGRGTGGVGS